MHAAALDDRIAQLDGKLATSAHLNELLDQRASEARLAFSKVGELTQALAASEAKAERALGDLHEMEADLRASNPRLAE